MTSFSSLSNFWSQISSLNEGLIDCAHHVEVLNWVLSIHVLELWMEDMIDVLSSGGNLSKKGGGLLNGVESLVSIQFLEVLLRVWLVLELL